MALIQCAEDCRHQRDGYCRLDKPAAVSSLSADCPYFTPKSPNQVNCFTQLFHTDQAD